ncbi:MAG: hypothetical protein Q9192_001252 [Flavoplaca navasiana]
MSHEQISDTGSEDSGEEATSLLVSQGHAGQHNISSINLGRSRIPVIERRQPSTAVRPSNGSPRKSRTPNRVRFDIEQNSDGETATNSHTADFDDDEGYLLRDTSIEERGESTQRPPLLTGIEAPSVTVASTDLDVDAEHLLDIGRPKSGMRSAFMNMANSIMYVSHLLAPHGSIDSQSLTLYRGAGIIGLPS